MICEKCGKKIDFVMMDTFTSYGDDEKTFVPLDEESGRKENCVVMRTDYRWTGYDLGQEERVESIHCPECGKFPFADETDANMDVVDVTEVMCWKDEKKQGTDGTKDDQSTGNSKHTKMRKLRKHIRKAMEIVSEMEETLNE